MLFIQPLNLTVQYSQIIDQTRLKTLFQPQDDENTDKSEMESYLYKTFDKKQIWQSLMTILTIPHDKFDNSYQQFAIPDTN